MREIKFRAWDESQKYMAYQGTPDLETIQSFMHHFGDRLLMQYTGLKDEHGKEIYEGDIVRLYKHIAEVIFVNGAFKFAVKNSLGQDRYLSPAQKFCEVIGNIYEHPHLLKFNK